MTDAVETMAWTGETPWHGLGFEVSNKLTPQQMLKAAKLDWKVEKRPLFYPGKDGEMVQVKDKFALVRDKDHAQLSVVGSTYKPVQNERSFEFFKKFVMAGHMNMETAGSLHGGQYIWALARIGKDFKLAGGDEVRGFLLLSSPHVLGKAMVIQFTPIRVVCWNTLSWALGSNLKGKAGAFRMPHSIEFTDAVAEKAELALGLAQESMDQFKDQATHLSKKKATDKQVEAYFADVLGWTKEKQAEAAKKKAERAKKKKLDDEADAFFGEPRMLPKLRLALQQAPGADMQSARGTWWGALNAVTYVVDHEIGRDQSASLRTAWLGAKAALKRRAVDLAMARAK